VTLQRDTRITVAEESHGAPHETGARARIIAFYLPQFHPIAENDAWWEPGFTEWANVSRAKPLYPGHSQPKLPTELGYYDLRVPETRERQAALARDYGIEGFCYWHYWFEGRRVLERPFAEVLVSGRPELGFCLGWANQSWTGIWHGAPDRVLIQQTYGGEHDARRHFEAVLPAFRDQRYLSVEGRPIFVVYMPHEMPEIRAFAAHWREWARAEGFPGLFLLGVQDAGWKADENGLDGTIMANPWRVLEYRPRSALDQITARLLAGRDSTRLAHDVLGWPTRVPYQDVLRYALPPQLSHSEFPTILPNWDNTPRSGANGVVITGSTPDLFFRHVEQSIRAVASRFHEHRLVFLKSWNEWAEGNYVEPDLQHGRAYLQALQRANTAAPDEHDFSRVNDDASPLWSSCQAGQMAKDRARRRDPEH
jgi:hypothetical protein